MTVSDAPENCSPTEAVDIETPEYDDILDELPNINDDEFEQSAIEDNEDDVENTESISDEIIDNQIELDRNNEVFELQDNESVPSEEQDQDNSINENNKQGDIKQAL